MDAMIDLRKYVDATPPCAVHLTSRHELLAFAACMTADGMPWAEWPEEYAPEHKCLKWALGEIEATGGIYAEVTAKYEGKWLRENDDRVPAMYYCPNWSDLVAEQRYEVVALNDVNEALRGKVAEQKKFINDLDADNSRLIEVNEKLEGEIARQKQSIKALRDARKDADDRSAELEDEAVKHRNEIERLKREITKSRDAISVQVEELKDQVHNLKIDLAVAKGDASSANVLRDMMHNQLLGYRAAVFEMQGIVAPAEIRPTQPLDKTE